MDGLVVSVDIVIDRPPDSIAGLHTQFSSSIKSRHRRRLRHGRAPSNEVEQELPLQVAPLALLDAPADLPQQVTQGGLGGGARPPRRRRAGGGGGGGGQRQLLLAPLKPRKRAQTHDADGRFLGVCECGVPASSRTVKKPGPTHGRAFWSCGNWRMVRQQKQPKSGGGGGGGADSKEPCGFFQWQ